MINATNWLSFLYPTNTKLLARIAIFEMKHAKWRMGNSDCEMVTEQCPLQDSMWKIENNDVAEIRYCIKWFILFNKTQAGIPFYESLFLNVKILTWKISFLYTYLSWLKYSTLTSVIVKNSFLHQSYQNISCWQGALRREVMFNKLVSLDQLGVVG